MHEEISIPELTDVIARLAALLGPRQGDIRPLQGGISNRNLLVNLGGTDYVVRLPGKDTELLGIDRESERLATRKAADLAMAPRVVAMLDDPPCLVTCFVEAEPMTPEELRAEGPLEQVASSLRKFHDSGLELPARFDAPELIRRYADHASSRGVELPEGSRDAIERAGAIDSAVSHHPDHQPKPTHNDLLAANFLRAGDRVVIVDWEYAGMGDPFFDLGSFAANNELSAQAAAHLLEAYFAEPPGASRVAALNLFRFLSDLREAMWGVVQDSVSQLDWDFQGYATLHFARLAESGADKRFGSWLDEAGERVRS